MRIYFDNAASAPLDPEVLDVMIECYRDSTGNPSSIHTNGREARVLIERSRKNIARLLGTSPSEIFFTSGGTEADNTAIISTCLSYGFKHLITSPLEHHAVLHAADFLKKYHGVEVHYVSLHADGSIDSGALEDLLKKYPSSLVSLMEANNELGNITDIKAVGTICRAYGSLFHSDTVQTVGHYKHDLKNTPVDFITASAHKFHGPKGTGFLYINADKHIGPFLHGGSQERNMRGGTENVAGIVGMAFALEKAYNTMEADRAYVLSLKAALKEGLQNTLGNVVFNGLSGDLDKSLYTVLSVGLPPSDDNDLLLFNLDIKKISASAGSACTSGTNIGSHVLQAIKASEERGHIRFSFSKFNTMEEVQYVVDAVKELFSESNM